MFDIETATRFLAALKRPDELIELRGIAQGAISSGVYRSHAELLTAAQAFAGDLYISVNSIHDNAPTYPFQASKTAIKTEHIARRTSVLVDFDPDRPKGTASNDSQHDKAIGIATNVQKWLTFPMMVCDSGSGAHLRGLIDLPPQSDLVKRLLYALRERWGTPEIKVDVCVHDAARISRLIGSHNYKSDRQSKILDLPELRVITAEELEELCPKKRASEKAEVQGKLLNWQLGDTPEERRENLAKLMDARGIVFTWDDWSKIYHFDCRCCGDTKNHGWFHVTDDRTTGGCWKCGANLQKQLNAIAPEFAKESAEAYDDPHRIARAFLKSRHLVFWQGVPYYYKDGCYGLESDASLKAEVNLFCKGFFNRLEMKTTPAVTNTLVNNIFSAIAALTFDRNPEAPHWL